MTLRPLTILLMAGAGWTALASGSALGAACDQELAQVREQLTRIELSSAERHEYQALLQAALAMQQNGDEQICIDILNRTQGLVDQRAAAEPGAADGVTPTGAADRVGYVPKDARPFSQIARFESIRDLPVVNAKGETLGGIVDLVVNFDNRTIQYALLSMSSGLFGDDKVYPVPIEVLKVADGPERVERDDTSTEAAPTPAAGATASDAATPVAPETEPGATAPAADQAAANAARTAVTASPSPPVIPAIAPLDEGAAPRALADKTVGDLVGSEVRNARDEAVGTVDAVILPPGATQIQVVLNVGGILGIGDKPVALALNRLSPDEDGLRLETAVTEDELKQLPAVEVAATERLPDETLIADLLPSTPAPSQAAPTSPARTAPSAATGASDELKVTVEATVDDGARAPGAAPAADRPPAAAPATDRLEDPLANKVIVLDIDRATLEQAPGFAAGAYPNLADAEWHRTVLAFYENVLRIDPGQTKQD